MVTGGGEGLAGRQADNTGVRFRRRTDTREEDDQQSPGLERRSEEPGRS